MHADLPAIVCYLHSVNGCTLLGYSILFSRHSFSWILSVVFFQLHLFSELYSFTLFAVQQEAALPALPMHNHVPVPSRMLS